ncbi:MAG: SHOCT domain-containing protein [Deltaproteobacteria bacterium]|nr:SHOCT domain-containing protein [Deltaproteobacteria bacterium]
MWTWCTLLHFSRFTSFFPGGIVFALVWILILSAIVYVAARLFRTIRTCRSRINVIRADSLEILKTRYARGEISSQEYMKMKDVLSDGFSP